MPAPLAVRLQSLCMYSAQQFDGAGLAGARRWRAHEAIGRACRPCLRYLRMMLNTVIALR